MASYYDSRETFTAIASVLTAYSSATGVSTATFAASIASQQSADTSLTAWESKMLTQVSTGLSSVTPSTPIHTGLSFGVDNRSLVAAVASLLTAWTSASGVSTSSLATQITSQIAVQDVAGLTNVEIGLGTLFSSAIATATPSAAFHNTAGSVDTRQIITWFSSMMRALCLAHASGTTTDCSGLVTSVANMNTADTGLTAVEKSITSAISSAINSATPSTGIHSGTIG